MSYAQALDLARMHALQSLVHTMQNADTWAERRRAAIAVLEAPEPNEPEQITPPAAQPAQTTAAPTPLPAPQAAPAPVSATSDITPQTSDIDLPDRMGPNWPNADDPHGHSNGTLNHLNARTSREGKCLRCGYDLAGMDPEASCPECGE